MASEPGQNRVSVHARARRVRFWVRERDYFHESMEASERHELTLDRKAPDGAPSARRTRLIDPDGIDYGSARGLARLELMVGTVFDRLTAVDVVPGADA